MAHLQKSDHQFFPPLSSRVNLEVYARKLASFADNYEAWDNEELIGIISAYMNNQQEGVAFISNVSVLAPYTGKGLASRLLDDFLVDAKAKKFNKIMLEAHEENRPACLFYLKKGFNVVENNQQIVKMFLEI